MEDFKNSTQYMDELLGSNFLELLLTIPGSSSIVLKKIISNKNKFEKKINELNLDSNNPEKIHTEIQNKLKLIEESLQSQFTPQSLISRNGIKNLVENIYQILPDQEKIGWYIKNTSAESIIEKHPPKNLLSFIEKNGHKAITGNEPKATSLQLLTMTRHTESEEWQKEYADYLKKLSPDDFEERKLDFIILDTNELQSLFNQSGQHQKPWRISHTKETGTISCFTLDNYNIYQTPILLYISVFMHYFFETSCSGLFFKSKLLEKSNDFGLNIKEIITTSANKFSFFHPNSYSENLFWQKAIALLAKSSPLADLSYFTDSITCGERLSSEDILSPIITLNIVDHIWIANFSQKSSAEAYFKVTSRNYLYHFREGLWSEIFREILGITDKQMDNEIITNLNLGDIQFTNKMISSYIKENEGK